MNAIIEHINSAGYAFVGFAAAMLIQSGLLILLLLLADFALRKRVRAVFRYWIWMLVLVKLLLPTSLSGPFSLGYWFGDEIASVDVSHSSSEAQPQAGEAPVLPHIIDLSKVRPPVYRPSVTPSPGETDLAPVESIAPLAVPAVPITWQGVVFLLWLAVAAGMLLLLGQRAIFVRGLVAQAKNANRPMLDTLDQCRKSMKIKRLVSLKVSPNATSPAVCGLWRPVILIPHNMPAALGSADLRVVLLHELAHIKRGDLWVNLIQTLLQIVYFYNPLLWLANAVIRRAREQAVDEAVLVAMGEKASQYPQTLVSVAKLAFKRPTLSLRLIGVVESKSALTARIKRILNRPIPKSAKLGILGLALIVITAAILLPMAGEKVEIGEGPEREMTLTLGWNGEKVEIPAPVVFPEWGRKTEEYKRWEKIGDARTFTTYDTEGYKYVAHALGFSTDSNGVRHETIPNVQRFRPDGTLEVDTTYSPDGRPWDWRLYDKQGRKKVYAANYPGARDQKGGVVFYGPDGKEAKEWQVSEFDVVYGELITDPNGRRYFSHYEKELIHSPYPETFVARLPNGVTVELVGVCEHPSEGKQWWKPDGDELLEVPYDEIGGNVYPNGDEKSFEFAVKLRNLPAEHVNTKVRCEESVGGTAGGSSSPEKNGKYLSDFRWLATTFPKKLKACTVKVGVAAGQWQSVAESNGKGFGSRGSELGGVSFTKAFEVEDGISITVADDILGRPCRVVAITNDGKVAKPVGSSGSSAGKARQTTAKFNNISLSDIKEFQFQTRPYEWAEFKNVSLRPGVKTDVQVQGMSAEETGPAKLAGSGYEKAEASKDLKVKVGPTTFEVNTVVRWDGSGNPIFENGRGQPLTKIGFMGPDYSRQARWMDIANIYFSPDSVRYDVLELRVFDHQTREMLSPKGRIGVGYDVQRSRVQLRSIGAPLPKAVDVWFRLLHNPAKDRLSKLDAKPGASVKLDRETFSVRVIKGGSWSYSTKRPPASPTTQIQWTDHRQWTGHQEDGTTTVVFDFTNVHRSIFSGPPRYQICAVAADGRRYVPDFPHFIGIVSGATQIVNFHLPAEKLSRFEVRRFHGRDRFYFDNVKLPRIPRRTFAPPPPVTVPVNGKKTEYTSTCLDPISLNVHVLPGIAAASVQGGSGTRPARVYPASEPHGNPDTQSTAIYDFHGIELNRCFLTYLDDQGAPVTSRSTNRIAHGAPARQFAGYERVEIPIEKIAQIRLSLTGDDPAQTNGIRPRDKTVRARLSGRVVDEQGKPVEDAQVALSTETIGVRISNGKLEPIRKDVESRIVQTDSQGSFNPGRKPGGGFDLVVACDRGFAFVKSEDFAAPYEIRIKPWGRIEGQLAPGREAADNKMWLASLPNPTWFIHKRECRYETMCDESGRFAFEKVPPGWVEVGYMTRMGENLYSYTCRTPVEVKMGQTGQLTLGGRGRPVIGKFAPPAGYDKPIYFGAGLRALVTVRPKAPRPDDYDRMTEEQQRQWREQWRKTSEYEKFLDAGWRNKSWRHYTFDIHSDGSFRIEDVIAGTYDLTVWLEERDTGKGPPKEFASYYGTIEVAPIPGGRSDEPLDLGTLELALVEKTSPDKTDSTQPKFSATLPSGVAVELIGLCGYPSEGKNWWRSDGTLLTQAPFGDTGSWIPVTKESKSYKFAVRLLNLPVRDGSTTFNYKHRYSAGRTHYFSGFKSVNVEAGSRTCNVPIIEVPVVPPQQQSTNFGFAVAGGEWTTAATIFSDPGKNASAKTHDKIIMKTPFEQGDETIICVSFPRLGKALRVIATDLNGRTHRLDGLEGGLSPEGGISQYTYRTKKPLKEIASFAAQTQEFQWAEFKNVSLRPKQETAAPAVNSARPHRKRYFVTLVATDGGVILGGRKLTWEQVTEKLKNVPERGITVLEVGVDQAILPEGLRGSAMLEWVAGHEDFQRAGEVVRELGFEGLSNVGVDDIDSRRGPVSVRLQDALRFGGQIPVNLESFEEQPLLRTKSIEFGKTDTDVHAVLKAMVTSYPKKSWEIGVRLLDGQGKQITSVVNTFENSGYAVGYPIHSQEEMNFSFGQAANLADAKRFEVKLREFTNELAAGKTAVQVKGELVSFAQECVTRIMQACHQEQPKQDYTNYITESLIYHIDSNDLTAEKKERQIKSIIESIKERFDPNLGHNLAIRGFSDRMIVVDIYNKEKKTDVQVEVESPGGDRGGQEPPANSIRDVPAITKMAQSVVQIDVVAVEVVGKPEMDAETTAVLKNILGDKTAPGDPEMPANKSALAAEVLLRKAVAATDVIEDASGGNKRVTEEEFKAVVETLVSRGYMKILMNPTLQLLSGKTAKIKSSNGSEAAGDSFEVTARVLDDGYIDLQARAVLNEESTPADQNSPPLLSKRELSTTARIRSGTSFIMGGVKKSVKRPVIRGKVEYSEEQTTEVLVILTATIIAPPSDPQKKPDVQVSAEELIAKIIESEKKIKDIRLQMTCTIGALDRTFYEYDWGYEDTKEFLSGTTNTKDSRTGAYRSVKVIRAFDGKREWLFRNDPKSSRPNGGITKPNPNFSFSGGIMTFNTLLGFDAKELSRLSLGQAIAQAESVSVKEQVELIDGRPCYVIEAINLETDPSVHWAYDVRAWIDYQRDYRPLKFEKYRSIPGKNRFKVVSRRVDNIKLEQIDGVWLPIEGTRTTFSTNDIDPPEGMTAARFGTLPSEQRLQLGVFKLTPMVPTRKLEIDVESIRLNKGISPEAFTIAFPKGCEVYDEFAGNRYIVGEQSEKDAALSDGELIEQTKKLSVGELIDVLRSKSLGLSKRRWFAVIHRLVEIGPPAVPQLVAEIRKTEKPRTQSRIALTLRAIGDLNAVAGLIDALERSGFSSDYGLGEPKTELGRFYKTYQMDPAKKGLGLGRPVREITIALERLTGHSEGHDHFHAYDSAGNRLGGYTVTPEIRDRQRQHRRQVAQKWRTWWQANKDKIKPPEMPPTPPAEPKPPKPIKHEGMVLAAPEGAELTLAIVPNIGDSARQPRLTKEQYQKYLDDLAENGPFAGSVRGDSFQWSAIKGDTKNYKGLPLSAYKERTYILLCARAQYVMIPEVEGKWIWGLEAVEVTRDMQGRDAISVRFDEKGAELLAKLTKANIDNHLALAVDGWVRLASVIQAPVKEAAFITGDFPAGEVRTLVEDLKKGMPVVDQQAITAMQQIAEAAEKLNKDDLAKMGPRQVVENLFAVGLSGNAEKLTWFFRPGSVADGVFSVRDFAQMADGHKIKVLEVHADSNDALAVTSNIKGKSGDQEGQLIFYLSKQTGTWLIHDADVGDPQRVEIDIANFKNRHRDAVVTIGATNLATKYLWGEAVNGLRAAVEFVPDKQQYSFGEKTEVRLHIQNVSEKPIQFTSSDPVDSQAVIEDDKGRQGLAVENISSYWPIFERYHLQPGKKLVLKTGCLGIISKDNEVKSPQCRWMVRGRPGVYFAQFVFRLSTSGPHNTQRQPRSGEPLSLPLSENDWKGTLETGKHKLVVTGEVDPRKMTPPASGKLTAVGGKGSVVDVDPNAADVLTRYWRALEQSEWDTALSLCCEEVRKEAKKYSSPESFLQAVVPIKEILKKAGRPRTGYWPQSPKYFAYIFDVRISDPGPLRDSFWVWKVRQLEGQKKWEIAFPTIAFESWLSKEKEAIERAAKERQQQIEKLAPRLKGVQTLLTVEDQEFAIAEPVYFRLQLINQGDSAVRYDDQQVAVNNSMTITGPDGERVRYTTSMVQTVGAPEIIKPGETKTLFDQFDMTKQYDIRQPGQYRVQFNGNGLSVGVGKEDTSDLNDPTSFEYYPGILPSNVVIITIHSGIKQETLDVGKDGVEGEKAVSQTNTEDKSAVQVEGKEEVPGESVERGDMAMHQKLEEMDRLRNGRNTPWDKVDQMVTELTAKYRHPADQGLIYYFAVGVHGMSGLYQPEKCIEYAKKAEPLLKDPARLIQLYIFWGDAIQRKHWGASGQELAAARRELAPIYLRGAKVAVDQNIPDELPQLPKHPGMRRFWGFSAGMPSEMKRHMEQEEAKWRAEYKAWKTAKDLREFQEEIMFLREYARDKAIQYYAKMPFDTAEFKEMAMKILEDQEELDLLLRRLQERIKERTLRLKTNKPAVQVEVRPGKLSGVTDLPNNQDEPQGNTDEVKYEGRTIAEWMAQWDTRVSDDIDAATNALIKIGRPAVPRMVEEVKRRTNHGWHAVGVLSQMGPVAEDAVALLIATALDKDLRFGDGRQSTTAYRGSVLGSLSRMTWARDRVIPVLQKVAEDSEEEAGVRRQVILALRGVGKGAMPILQKLTEVEERSVRDAAHGALGQLLEKEEGLSKDDYYTPLIEKDPFGPSVLQYIGNAKGIANYGRPHPLTQKIKKLYRERLAKQPDPQLAWQLAAIIQNGLRNTDIVWAAPTGGGASQWDREDPAESYATLAEVLELGFRHAEANSELQLKFGISLAKLRLLEGDWDGMNEMLQALGQEPIPKESRQWLADPRDGLEKVSGLS